MGKGVHKVFKAVLKDISQDLPHLGESGSEVSHFIPEPRNFSEVTKLSDDIKKPWLKETLKEIKTDQQSDFTSWKSKERWTFNYMHGCVQGKKPMW